MRAIIFKTLSNVTNVLTTMHNINRATKNSHVKTNLVHTLHRMQKVRTLLVEEFKSILTQEELQAASNAVNSTKDNKPWYNIPRAKFLEFIHSVRDQKPNLFVKFFVDELLGTHVRLSNSKILQKLEMRHRESMRTSTTRAAGPHPSFEPPS